MGNASVDLVQAALDVESVNPNAIDNVKSRKFVQTETLNKPFIAIEEARSASDFRMVKTFRKEQYSKCYPEITISDEPDPFDEHAVVLFSWCPNNRLDGTARIVLDSELGLPDEDLFKGYAQELRAHGKRLAEVGRFAIYSDSTDRLKQYYREFWLRAVSLDVDDMLILVKQKDVKFHQNVVGAELVHKDVGTGFGSPYIFAAMRWGVSETRERFFRWCGLKEVPISVLSKEPTYDHEVWSEYARLHRSVTASVQVELYRECAGYLDGAVVDCGCGTAKLGPLLDDVSRVHSYTGIDSSIAMLHEAKGNIQLMGRVEGNLFESSIEDHIGVYDSAISINSYYTWVDRQAVLNAIYQLVRPGGVFVLATPNPRLSMAQLIYAARKEQGGHPDFNAFAVMNQKLAANDAGKFDTLDQVVEYVKAVGFKLQQAHQKHYLGGVNLLVFERED